MIAPVDQAARDRITTTGLRETLFVDAGAGTGKTSTLVDRILHLVLHEQVSLRDLAAITFSEAAAAELRDRVRRALDNGARADDAIAAQRCADALADFDTAAISTLHGFAHRLLREHPIEVAIPPRVEVLDEVQSILAFEDRWDAHVDRWQSDEQYVPLVVRLWSCGIELRRAFGPSLKDVAAVLDDNWDRLEEFTPPPMRLPRALDRRPLLAAIDDAIALGEECLDADDKLLLHLATLIPEWCVVRDLDPLDDDRLVALLRKRSKWSHGRKGTKKTWPDVESARARVGAVDEAAAALYAEAVDDALSIWLGVLHVVTLAAAHERRDAGQLEFHDLLVLARRLLRTSLTARRDVHQRYTRVLLDEFQDTDPIQIELALRIAADPAHDAADWRDLKPPPGRLFFVGDPKQSIYRFRRADIALFHEARDLVGAAAQVSLVQNFRTVEPILAWVNAVFDALMPEESPSQPRYRPLAAMRGASELADHRVVLFGAAHLDDPPAAELRRREAADVAAIVDTIRADPSSRPVWSRADDGTESWRPARCSDITVLIPSRTSLPMLEGALVAADVPYRVDTTTLVFESPEIRDLLAVLMAVDDPADAVSVVAALRSPVLACSDPDLLDWVQFGGTFDYRGAGSPGEVPRSGLEVVAARHGAVAEAMAALSAWHDAARWCEPATLLERIVRERDVFALALTDRRPRDVWRRVRFLIDQARQFADVGGGHLRAFVRWADLQRHEGSRVPEPLLPETDDDAVRIMTFHGAKGLEFPIVVLSGLTTRPGGARSGPQVNWHPDGRPEISLGAGKATAHFEVLNEFESEMDVDEKLRLLYVGATRARDHLFVSTHRRAKDDGSNLTYGARVQTVSAAHAEGLFVGAPAEAALAPGESERSVVAVVIRSHGAALTANVEYPAPDDPLVVEHRMWCADRTALLETFANERPAWSATAIAAAMAHEFPRSARPPAPFGSSAEVDAMPEDATGEPAPRGGTAFGRAVHAVLQHAAPPPVFGSPDLAALARRAAAEALLDPMHVPAVEAAAAQVLASPTVAAAFSSSRRWRELPVCAVIGAGGSPDDTPGASVLLEGFVDLLAELDGSLVLVDYKTDRVDPGSIDAHVARYAPQLAAYALAIESAIGRPVDRAVLVFATTDAALEREIPDFADVKAQVVSFLDRVHEG